MADITFSCSHCGQHIAIDVSASGAQVRCPTCQGDLLVPQKSLTQRTGTSRGLSLLAAAVICILLAAFSIWWFTSAKGRQAGGASAAQNVSAAPNEPPVSTSQPTEPVSASRVAENAPAPEANAEAELANKYAVVSTVVTNTTAKWSTNWNAFIAEFEPFFEKGEVTTADSLVLAKRFHAHAVTWTGTIQTTLTNGSLGVAMPEAKMRYKRMLYGTAVTNTATIDHLSLAPESVHSNAWAGLLPGQRVTFRTILVGPALGPVLWGMGPNEGTVIVFWRTKDAELIRSGSPAK
jgi:hypothetical protein